MANIINTSFIQDPAIQQPFTGPSLAFLQNSIKEQLSAIVQNLAQNQVSQNGPYSIYGCQKTSLGGSNYSYSPGYIWYAGEIYYFQGTNLLSVPDTDICTIVTQNDVNDPIYFSDLNPYYVLNHRIILISDGLSGSGTFNYSTITPLIATPYVKQRLYTSLIQTYSPNTGVTTLGSVTTPNDGTTRTYLLQMTLNTSVDGKILITNDSGQTNMGGYTIYIGSYASALISCISHSASYGGYAQSNGNIFTVATIGPGVTINFNMNPDNNAVLNGNLYSNGGYATVFEL